MAFRGPSIVVLCGHVPRYIPINIKRCYLKKYEPRERSSSSHETRMPVQRVCETEYPQAYYPTIVT